MLNEALIKPKPLLDQLAEGLECLGILQLIRAFPVTLGLMFMAQQPLSAAVVKNLLVKPSGMTTARGGLAVSRRLSGRMQ